MALLTLTFLLAGQQGAAGRLVNLGDRGIAPDAAGPPRPILRGVFGAGSLLPAAEKGTEENGTKLRHKLFENKKLGNAIGRVIRSRVERKR